LEYEVKGHHRQNGANKDQRGRESKLEKVAAGWEGGAATGVACGQIGPTCCEAEMLETVLRKDPADNALDLPHERFEAPEKIWVLRKESEGAHDIDQHADLNSTYVDSLQPEFRAKRSGDRGSEFVDEDLSRVLRDAVKFLFVSRIVRPHDEREREFLPGCGRFRLREMEGSSH